MDEVFLLWWRYAADPDDFWRLHGVFLTATVANNRLDSCEKAHPARKWRVSRRQIGILADEVAP